MAEQKRMTFTTSCTKWVTTGSVFACVLTVAATTGMHKTIDFPCQPSFTTAAEKIVTDAPALNCAQPKETVSWLSWFTGKSSSYQFHFLDLLELLSRGDQQTQASANPVEK